MLALIIVYHSNREMLDEFLGSLEKNSNHAFTLFVTDASQKLTLEKQYSFPIVILSHKNRGYSAGINHALRAAQKIHTDQFCVLNYDTVVLPNFIDTVIKGFLSADIFGGKIYYAKGFEFHTDKYKKTELGHVLWYAGGSVDWKHAFITHRGVDEVDTGSYDTFEETSFVTGCLYCFSLSVIEKIGMWDEHYFLYYEDADYSVRAQRGGFRLYYNPDVILYHKNGGLTGGSGSLLHQQTQEWSRLYFGLRFAPVRTKLHLVLNYVLSYLHGDKKKDSTA
jgi:hypothetical protein